MGDNETGKGKGRRWFLSLFAGKEKEKTGAKPDMVKMLTADGKLVQIDRAVLESATKKQRSSNKEIFDWMKNPSKDRS